VAKAKLTLANGTVVEIDGSAEEVRELLDAYSVEGSKAKSRKTPASTTTRRQGRAAERSAGHEEAEKDCADIAAIVNQIKSCDAALAIESAILDRRDQVNRILLPMFIVHEELESGLGLTSGDIATVTKELGAPIKASNVSKALAGSASSFVMGDRVRKRGQAVRYLLNRRGVQRVRDVIDGAGAS